MYGRQSYSKLKHVQSMATPIRHFMQRNFSSTRASREIEPLLPQSSPRLSPILVTIPPKLSISSTASPLLAESSASIVLPDQPIEPAPAASVSIPMSNSPRFSSKWWLDVSIIMTVFALAGSITARTVRPFLNLLGVEGAFIEGPWTFRLCYLAMTLPLHSSLLLVFGFCFGRGAYFRFAVRRMWSRIIPKRFMR